MTTTISIDLSITGYKTSDLQKRIAYHEHAATNPYGNLDQSDMDGFKAKAESLRKELEKLTKRK